MQRWGNKKAAEVRQRTYVLQQSMLDAGVTITAIVAVTVAMLDGSAIIDPSPNSLYVTSSAITNAAPFTRKNRNVGIAQAVILNLTGGLTGADYVVSLKLTLSTGETFCVDIQQSVTQFVTTP